MTKPNHPKKKSEKPEETPPIDEALIRPDQVAEMVPNELQLAQLVVARLPFVVGYNTLPDHADRALHEVLEVLSAIRRWRNRKSSSISIAAPYIEDLFKLRAEGRNALPSGEFVEILLFDRHGNRTPKSMIEGWKMFCEERSLTQADEGWPIETAVKYGDDFRAWFTARKTTIETRPSRSKGSRRTASDTATRPKVRSDSTLTKGDEKKLKAAAKKHFPQNSRQRLGNSKSI